MGEFFVTYWPEIVLSLITAGALAFCRYAYKQIQNYKKLLAQQDEDQINAIVVKKLEPYTNHLNALQSSLQDLSNLYRNQINIIIDSYRFRLIQLCKQYLDQGHLSTKQYEQLSEMYKLYSGLGGNGQGKNYYERTIELPIKDE